MRVTCPKCQSTSAWFSRDRTDVILRCICGYHKVVETVLESLTITHTDTRQDVSIPKQGTKLHNCMNVLFANEPATSLQVTNALNDLLNGEVLTVNEVSSQLTVLRYKGIVTPIDNKKGIAGGSTWKLTDLARTKLGGK